MSYSPIKLFSCHILFLLVGPIKRSNLNYNTKVSSS